MAEYKKRVPLILFALLAIAVGAIVGVANWALETTQKRLLHEMEQDLLARASNQVALLTVWSGTVHGQVEAFAGLDMLRLFAAEADSLSVPGERLFSLSRKPAELAPPPVVPDRSDNDGLSATPDFPIDIPDPNLQESKDEQSRLAARVPLMQKQLVDFTEKNSFSSVTLLNRKLEICLSTEAEGAVPENLKNFFRQAVDEGRPVMLPVRRERDDVVMDMAFPVFAPQYFESSGKKVVGVLVGTCKVLHVVQAVNHTEESGVYSSAVLENFNGSVRLIDEAGEAGSRELSGWQIRQGKLPFARRDAPTSGKDTVPAYALASPVPDMPWLVLQGVPAADAEDEFMKFRKNVIIVAGLAVAVAGIMTIALWWWLVGRRERAVADEMRRLYVMVSEQKQIMDSINAALPAGIVLNDLSGIIYYANRQYADMVGIEAERMQGLAHTKLAEDMARSLVTHTLAVNQSGDRADFTETLPVAGQERNYLTTCSPFRDDQGRLVGMVSVYSDITELVQAQNRVQQMVSQSVAVFVRAIEAIDPYLCGQSSFTAQLAVTLAHCLGVNDDATESTLRTAASLSQVGMIQLPKELLTKAGVLTDDERRKLRKHVEYARAALSGIDFGLPVLPAITQMYERLDGSGYPAGLKGGEICLNARILAVANTFCALARPRSYRAACNIEKMLSILSVEPAQYDPRIVQALREFLLTERGARFMRQLQGDADAKSSGGGA